MWLLVPFISWKQSEIHDLFAAAAGNPLEPVSLFQLLRLSRRVISYYDLV
jgi:hypothetical protein